MSTPEQPGGFPEPAQPYGTPQQPPSGAPQQPEPTAPPTGVPAAGTPAYAPPGQQASYPPAPGDATTPYPAATPGVAPSAYGAPAPKDPGKTFGIVGFILSFLGCLSIVGIALSIVGLVKSKKVGRTNALAIAGIIIGALVFLGTIASWIWLAANFDVLQVCLEYGEGVHRVDGYVYTCG